MMSNKELKATYLVDSSFLLHLKEEPGGFRYHCFDKKNGSPVGDGMVSWGDMENSMIRGNLACARIMAMDEIELPGIKVSTVSQDMLAHFLDGRRLLRELGEDTD